MGRPSTPGPGEGGHASEKGKAASALWMVLIGNIQWENVQNINEITRIRVTGPLEDYPCLTFEINPDANLTVNMTGSDCLVKTGTGNDRLQNTDPDPAKM